MRSVLRTSWPIGCIAIILLGIVASAYAQPDVLPEQGRQPRVPTSGASAVLRIVCPANSGLANPALIDDLVQTGEGAESLRNAFETDFGKEALQAVNEKGALFEISLKTSRFENLPAGVYMGDIVVASYDKRLPASKILAKVHEGLQFDLIKLDRDPRSDDLRRHKLEKEAAELQQRAIREAKEIENLERHHGVHRLGDILGQRFLRVEGELMAARLRVTGLKATRESLQKRIAELAPKVAAASQKDPVVIELEKVVRLREQAKESLAAAFARDQATQVNVLAAEDNLAQARAEYAKQTRLATQDAGGLRLTGLQQRLEDTESELEEGLVKAAQLEEQFVAVSQQGNTADIDHKKAQLELLRMAATKVTSEAMDARLQREFYVGPSVKLIKVMTSGEGKDK